MLSIINRLLPFATPGTPLLQDVVHLIAVCALLYFGPQIQDRLRRTAHAGQEAQIPGPADVTEPLQDNSPPADESPPEILHGPPVPDEAEDIVPGPAHRPDVARELPAQRNIGAKKAKSLARKDQRRAYHEFHRAQGEAQRAKDAEGADEREAFLAAEHERRRKAEAALDAKIAREREVKRLREQKEWEEELHRRNKIVSLVKEELHTTRACQLARVAKMVGGVNEDYVLRIVAATGMLGKTDDSLTMATSSGYIVRLSRDIMDALYEDSVRKGHAQLQASQLNALLSALVQK